MPNDAARTTPTNPAASAPPSAAVQANPSSQPIAFRDFDPDRVDEEFVSAETKVQTAVEHYESAKTVSKNVLEARVCV